jgi:hypothetical protein
VLDSLDFSFVSETSCRTAVLPHQESIYISDYRGSMSMPMMSSSALGARRQQLSETKAAERYLCFGRFHVDLQREELFKEGSRVRNPSKVFQVLGTR